MKTIREKVYIHVASQEPTNKQQLLIGFFGLKLFTCPMEKPRRSFEEAIIERRLHEQLALIRALHSLDDDCTYAIRYIAVPNNTSFSLGRVDIILYGKMQEKKRTRLNQKIEKHITELYILLASIMPQHHWQVINDADTFKKFWDPVDWEKCDFAEIRREVIDSEIGMHRIRPHLGTGSEGITCIPNDSNHIMHFGRFIPQNNTFSRFLRAMLLHERQIIFQVNLLPARLEESEEALLEKQIVFCEEKRSNFSQRLVTSLSSTHAIYQQGIQHLLESAMDLLLSLRNSAYLMSINLACENELLRSIIDLCGMEISSNSNQASIDRFGYYGYKVLQPVTTKDAQVALMNIRHFSFQAYNNDESSPINRLTRLFGPEEALCAFRLPVCIMEDAIGINVVTSQQRAVSKEIAQIATSISEDKVFLGENRACGFKQKVFLKETDRTQHMYLVGQTGTGKSTLMKSMIISDMMAGNGLALIDPHGDLFHELLNVIPENRLNDLVVIDPNDTGFPVGLNLLQCRNADERYYIVREMKAILEKLLEDQYGRAGKDYTGPIFYRHVQMNMLLAMSDITNPGTLLEFYEIFQTKDYWKKWLPLKNVDQKLKNWIDSTLSKTDYTRQNNLGDPSVGDYISSKFEDFVFDPKLRYIFGQRFSTIDFREIMDSGKILLVNLAKGELSESNSRFLGMILMAQIQAAAMQRVNTTIDKRPPFYLYVDEFQSIATQNFILLLSEARKFGLGLVLANQFVSQISNPQIIDSIFGNVGTIVCFRVGYEDAEKILEPHFLPYFDRYDLTNLPNWQACVRTTVSGQIVQPFSINTPIPGNIPRKWVGKKVLSLSRKKYGKPKKTIQEEIARSTVAVKKEESGNTLPSK